MYTDLLLIFPKHEAFFSERVELNFQIRISPGFSSGKLDIIYLRPFYNLN